RGRDPRRHRRHRCRRPRQRPGPSRRRPGVGRRPDRVIAARNPGRTPALAAGASGSVCAARRQRGRGGLCHHRQRYHRDLAVEHPSAAAGEHADRRTARGGARGQQAKRPGNAGNPRSRSTRAMACRRYPRGDHGGRGHRGLGDGGVHRLAAPRIHGGAGGAGGRSVGSNLGGLACLAGCAHRTGLTGRAGNLDQHPRRQPVARLHPPRPTRLGAGDSSRDCCDRRRRRAEPCADGSGQIGPAEPATTRDRCAFPRRVPRCAPRTSTTPTRHSTA
ncbi:LOW QUALITY PROTEIN: metal cation transporter P-type ATPase ctpH, partial [Mycobacterium tuberculosis T85]